MTQPLSTLSPFLNPADGKFYMYYRGKGKTTPEQTGLLVSDGDLGEWRRVRDIPVISADTKHERHGASHPSVAIEGDTIHIVYTGKATHVVRGGIDDVSRDRTNERSCIGHKKIPPIPFLAVVGKRGTAEPFVETELFKGPEYFHILYGGFDGDVWRIGHGADPRFPHLRAEPLTTPYSHHRTIPMRLTAMVY